MDASVLPQELIDEIIDAASGDLQSMGSLGLVGARWTRRTRKHLFRIVAIKDRSDDSSNLAARCTQLAGLLEANRELCEHPRELILHSSTVDPIAKARGRTLGWIQVCSEDLIKVVEMLQGISTVSLSKSKGGSGMDFAHLSYALCAALDSLLARPTITRLNLCGIRSIQLAPLVQHGSIKHIFMAFTYPSQAEVDACNQQPDSERPHSTTTVAPPARSECSVPSKKFLQTIEISGAGVTLDLLIQASLTARSALDLTQLKTVTVGHTMGWDSNMSRIWPTFLKLYCQNVEYYCVKPGPWKSVPLASLSKARRRAFDPAVYSFDQLPKLIKLDIEIAHYSLMSSNANLNTWPHLWDALDTLGSSSKPVPLRYLTLEFNFHSLADTFFEVTHTVLEVSKCSQTWRRLDRILSEKAFSNLDWVVVYMNLSGERCRFDQSREELEELRNGMRSYMPKLGERNKLRVVFHLPSRAET
ncbi:hypothetical protein MD484_g3753, partial [Candolleomyces efflorescens]